MKKIKGFTLTELIVGMVIFILIIVAATSILMSSQGILIKQTEFVQTSKIGDGICQMIRLKLTHAQDMNITRYKLGTDQDDIYNEVLYFQNGRVYFTARNNNSEDFYFDTGTQDLYGDEYYNGSLVQVKVKNPAENLIDVSVELFNSNEKGIDDSSCYQSDFNLLLSNMAEFGSGTLISDKNVTYTADVKGTSEFYIYLNS